MLCVIYGLVYRYDIISFTHVNFYLNYVSSSRVWWEDEDHEADNVNNTWTMLG